MSSDYFGGIAGEIADQGADTERPWMAEERAWQAWMNEYTRHEAAATSYDAMRAAFHAGAEFTRTRADLNGIECDDCGEVTAHANDCPQMRRGDGPWKGRRRG